MIPIPSSSAPDEKEAWKRLNTILERLTGGRNIDFHERRVINAGDGIDDQDYVTLRQLADGLAKKQDSTTQGTPISGPPTSSGGGGGSGGDTKHPNASTDNGIARYDGITGVLQDTSGPTLGDDGRISSLVNPSSLQDAATKDYVDSQIAALPAAGAAHNTFLVSGGQVVWISAYNFLVSAATYYILGVLYSSPETTITLDASDATDDRLDIIAVNSSGAVVKITGDPSAQPSEPDVDPSTQLKLAIVLVEASSTQPSTATSASVYAENAGSPTEWNWSTSGAGWTLGSLTAPHAGTKDIEATAVAAPAYVQAQIGAGTFDPNSYDFFTFFIRSKATWGNNRTLQIRLQLSGVVAGQTITIGEGAYGFNSANISGYQQIAIPILQFAVAAGSLINQVRITRAGGGTIGFYLDDVSFVKSGGTQTITGITQAQADARYAPLGPSFVTVAAESGLPSERRLVAGANVTITDNGAGSTIEIAASGGGGSGDVVGPAGSTDGDFAQFDGVTGKLLKDGGYSPASFDAAGAAAAAEAAAEAYADVGDAALAPKTADYLVKTADGTLTAERVVTDNTDITADWSVAGIVKFLLGAFTGDIAKAASSLATTIVNNAVTYAQMQNISAASRLLGRGSASGSGDPEEISLGANLSMSGTTLNAVGPGGGGVVAVDGFYLDDGSNVYGPTFGPFVRPVDGDFAWINQGSASLDTASGIFLLGTATAGPSIRIRKKAAPGSTPYTITIAFIPQITANSFASVGFILRQSSDGKVILFSVDQDNGFSISKWNSPTSFNVAYSPFTWRANDICFMRYEDDGTNRHFYISKDFQHWHQILGHVRTDFMTADEIGFAVKDQNTQQTPGMLLLSWEET